MYSRYNYLSALAFYSVVETCRRVFPTRVPTRYESTCRIVSDTWFSVIYKGIEITVSDTWNLVAFFGFFFGLNNLFTYNL